jgi:DNA-directed RNA polymerase subunit K/omega
MTMGHIDELIHRPLNPFIRVFLATGRAKTSLAGKRTFFLGSTLRANIFGIAIRRLPAGKHLLHRFHDGLPMRRLVSPG